jgi:hypothetical protein
MNRTASEPVLDQSGSYVSALPGVEKGRSGVVALPINNLRPPEPTGVLPDVSAILTFGPSHSHRVWRMMNALIDAVPDWAEAEAFEQARIKMLQYGLSIGLSVEELLRISDPDVILGLWTAAEAAEDQE